MIKGIPVIVESPGKGMILGIEKIIINMLNPLSETTFKISPKVMLSLRPTMSN